MFLGACSSAVDTRAVNNDVMRLETETRRQKLDEIRYAALQFEKPVALATAKVMMMGLPSGFVVGWLSRNFHRCQPSLVEEIPYGSVNRCNAQCR